MQRSRLPLGLGLESPTLWNHGACSNFLTYDHVLFRKWSSPIPPLDPMNLSVTKVLWPAQLDPKCVAAHLTTL